MKNLKKFIVCTSINKPTLAIKKFDYMRDWKLIVVGDKKTPKNYKLKNGVYLSPKKQEKIDMSHCRYLFTVYVENTNNLAVLRCESCENLAHSL